MLYHLSYIICVILSILYLLCYIIYLISSVINQCFWHRVIISTCTQGGNKPGRDENISNAYQANHDWVKPQLFYCLFTIRYIVLVTKHILFSQCKVDYYPKLFLTTFGASVRIAVGHRSGS